MQQKSKYPTISIRVEPKHIDLLEEIAANSNTTISSVCRNMLVTMISSYQKSKTEQVDKSINTIFEIMEIDKKAINTMKDLLLSQKVQNEKVLTEIDSLLSSKLQARQGMF